MPAAGVIGRLLAGVIVAASALAGPGPVASARQPAPAPLFGPILDWTKDSAHAYAERLGARPSVYGQAVRYPLSPGDDTYVRQFVDQVAAQGAVALLDVEPIVPLVRLTRADAVHLATVLKTLRARDHVRVLVRFGREMNGSWTVWGQQPRAYRTAFRTVANAVHAAVPPSGAAMVWAPVYGAGYPFGRSYGRIPKSGPVSRRALDTNHDGRVTDADDAYRPYYPGARYVDWVGLSMYDYGRRQRFGANVLTAPSRFLDELRGRFGYASPHGSGRAFAAQYALRRPMLVETAALYHPTSSGPSELAVKRRWWRQVLSPAARRIVAKLRMVVWLERRRPEEEVGNAEVDWRATRTPALAAALRSDLRADGFDLRPLAPGPSSAPPSASPTDPPGVGAGATATAGAQPGEPRNDGAVPAVVAIGGTAVAACGIALVQRRRRLRRRSRR